MRFDDTNPLHRLVLWTYLRAARTAPLDLVLVEWARCPRELYREVLAAAHTEFPRLKGCTCTRPVDVASSYLRHKGGGAIKLPPVIFTELSVSLVETYMRALRSKAQVEMVLHACACAPERTTRARLESYVWSHGGVDFMACVLAAGEAHADDMRALHRHVMNCIHDGAASTLIVSVGNGNGGKPWARELQLCTNVSLRCNANTTDGERCTYATAVKCETCRRAFYCSRECKQIDTAHVHECDSLKCRCSARRRRTRVRTRLQSD